MNEIQKYLLKKYHSAYGVTEKPDTFHQANTKTPYADEAHRGDETAARRLRLLMQYKGTKPPAQLPQKGASVTDILKQIRDGVDGVLQSFSGKRKHKKQITPRPVTNLSEREFSLHHNFYHSKSNYDDTKIPPHVPGKPATSQTGNHHSETTFVSRVGNLHKGSYDKKSEDLDKRQK